MFEDCNIESSGCADRTSFVSHNMNTNNGLYCYVTIEHTDLNFNKNSF